MNNTISIIIPVYNSSAFLQDCLNSVLEQTYADLQILCVNDGSTDQSWEIIQEFARKDSRILPITKENGGLSSARNKGLEWATGKYVMFLDSDDWLDLDICRKAVNEIEEFGVDLIMWSYVREYPNSSKPTSVLGKERIVFDFEGTQNLRRRLFGLIGNELADPSKGDSIVTVWGKLYKRELINGVRFIDTNRIGTEDSLYNIDVFQKLHSIIYLPVYGYHYRKYNAQSLTTAYNANLFSGWQNMYKYMEDKIITQNLSVEYKNALSNRRAINLIALGINIVSAPYNTSWKIKELKAIICQPVYQDSFQKLELHCMPIYWKLFFGLAKRKCAPGVYLLLLVIQKIRGK